jgi:hypothetical protein
MTPEEHTLILTMFVKQQQSIQAIANFLSSRGLASDDDLSAFEFAATQDAAYSRASLIRVKAAYLEFATKLGIETGLKPSP